MTEIDNTKKAVAIVGFASSSRHLAPYNDPKFEIWTMNHAACTWIPKWDVLFELHTLEHLRKIHAHDTDANSYMGWLGRQPGVGQEKHAPIIMQDVFAEVPASVKLPREEMNAWFAERGGNLQGFFAADYYTSTVSYMLAMAIMQGREEVHIYGVDLLLDEEYGYQRSGLEYLIGFARGMGIKVYIPYQSALCQANYTYGFSEPKVAIGSDELKPFIDYIEDKANTSLNMIEKAKQDAHTFSGATQALDMVLGWILAGGFAEVETSEGKVVKDLKTLVTEKRLEMDAKFRGAHDSVLTITGQSEAFKTTAVWAKHYARGGALKA